MKEKKVEKIDPKIKDALILLGAGTFLVASLVLPGLPIVARQIFKIYEDEKRQKDRQEWEKFNLWRLRQLIKRMQESKYVEIVEEKDVPVVKITERGKIKLLKYNIEEMKLDENHWDGKWRLIIYDVSSKKKLQSELFRKAIRKLNLLKLQKSVYLTPFKCENEIEYLRQMFGVGRETLILKVGQLENEQAYRRYFGL
ncbi:hypothetical protein HYU92_03330 [Candidatus Curtissbacteria bacterium]|nr:hypothetical protein [Candidatus Curtissbacteria bacterium]